MPLHPLPPSTGGISMATPGLAMMSPAVAVTVMWPTSTGLPACGSRPGIPGKQLWEGSRHLNPLGCLSEITALNALVMGRDPLMSKGPWHRLRQAETRASDSKQTPETCGCPLGLFG